MKIKRPLLIILIGAIIGIIYGLYLFTSIAITIILITLLLFLIQKNKSKTIYFLVKRRKIFLIFLISILISSLYTILVNSRYEKVYKEIPKNITTIATVVSEAKETEYYNSYEVKVNDKKFIMYVKKSEPQELKYGMKIKLEAEYTEPQEARNYKGFNYKEYLKTKKVYGTFKASKITILKDNDVNIFLRYSNIARNKIIETVKNILPEETEGLMVGILIGENEGISDEIKQSFSKSSLSHIVAISGSHITYIVVGISFILTKSKVPRRGIHITTIIALIIFMFLTRFSPSVVRACIMGIIMLFAKIVHRKLDILNSIAFSLLLILIDNPFAINDIGLQLSYLGTLGIVFLNKPILNFLEKYINKKIAEILSVTLSAQIAVLPITAINFNTISTVFIISNLIAVPLSGVITLFGYANALLGIIFIDLAKLIGKALNIITQLLIWIAKITAQIPFATITINTPSILFVIMYYICLCIAVKKGKLIIQIILDKIKKYKRQTIIILVLIILLMLIIKLMPNNFKVHFIDVGQRR